MVRRHMTRAAPSYVPVRQSSLPRRRAWPEHRRNTRRLAAGTGQKELAEYRLSVAWTLSMANRGGAVSVLAAGSDEATMLTIIQMYELLSPISKSSGCLSTPPQRRLQQFSELAKHDRRYVLQEKFRSCSNAKQVSCGKAVR
jgi:hypothetical protein